MTKSGLDCVYCV